MADIQDSTSAPEIHRPTRRGFFGHALGAYAAISAVGGAVVVIGSMEDLYRRWLVVREADDFDAYVALQRQIVDMEPVTARDLAIMYVVETDFGGSCMRDVFKSRVFDLAASA